MNILLVNDDGIRAPGLGALCVSLRSLGRISVAAPRYAQSAAAHSITVAKPINVRRIQLDPDLVGYSIEGTPADCVKLAVQALLDEPPDLVVSGINDGANIGVNVLYSGTVAAAAEAALLRIPAVAVSLAKDDRPDFARAGCLARHLIQQLLGSGLTAGCLVNINIPALSRGRPKGIKLVKQCTEIVPPDHYHRQPTQPVGWSYCLVSEVESAPTGKDCDANALRAGYVTITPLQLNLTDQVALVALAEQRWDLPPSDQAP